MRDISAKVTVFRVVSSREVLPVVVAGIGDGAVEESRVGSHVGLPYVQLTDSRENLGYWKPLKVVELTRGR